jgi:hypothetical protein
MSQLEKTDDMKKLAKKEINRRYYEKNKDKISAYIKEWKKANPDSNSRWQSNYRLRKKKSQVLETISSENSIRDTFRVMVFPRYKNIPIS